MSILSQLFSRQAWSERIKDREDEEEEVTRVSDSSPLKEFTLSEVADHCDQQSCWIVYWNHVYDVTDFIKEHPGGEDIILENAGRDVTVIFRDVGHSHDALLMMTKYCIGVLCEMERVFKRTKYESC